MSNAVEIWLTQAHIKDFFSIIHDKTCPKVGHIQIVLLALMHINYSLEPFYTSHKSERQFSIMQLLLTMRHRSTCRVWYEKLTTELPSSMATLFLELGKNKTNYKGLKINGTSQ